MGVLAFLGGLGQLEIVLIVVVILVLFGGKKLPELARGIGTGLREFGKAVRGVKADVEKATDMDAEPEQANAAGMEEKPPSPKESNGQG